jgi:hypothetical protein
MCKTTLVKVVSECFCDQNAKFAGCGEFCAQAHIGFRAGCEPCKMAKNGMPTGSAASSQDVVQAAVPGKGALAHRDGNVSIARRATGCVTDRWRKSPVAQRFALGRQDN